MNRRSLLAGILGASVAPVFVRAEALMPIVVPKIVAPPLVIRIPPGFRRSMVVPVLFGKAVFGVPSAKMEYGAACFSQGEDGLWRLAGTRGGAPADWDSVDLARLVDRMNQRTS